MALITIPYTFTVGTTISASEHNDNFNTVRDAINGNLDNANIKANAGIVDTKLAQISTASKVSGNALTALATIPASAGIIPNANVFPSQTGYSGYFATTNGTSVSWGINGSALVSMNASNFASGTLSGTYGGTGKTVFNSGTITFGDGNYNITFGTAFTTTSYVITFGSVNNNIGYTPTVSGKTTSGCVVMGSSMGGVSSGKLDYIAVGT